MPDEVPPTESSVYTARPLVEVDGQRVDLVHDNLVSFTIDEAEGGLVGLELTLLNTVQREDTGAGLAFEDSRSPLKFGAAIVVSAGDASAPVELFRGVITALENLFEADATPRLTVLAEDALLKARLARRTVTHAAGTLADLIRTIAGAAGLRPTITGCDAAIGVQVQHNEADLAFLRRIGARYDVDCQVVGEELQASPRGQVQRSTQTIALRSQLRRLRGVADLAHQATAVTLSGWDAAQGQAIAVTSSGAADAGPGSDGGGTRGDELLRQTLGERNEHLGHRAVADRDEAQALVDAAFSARLRSFATIEGAAEGNPRLRVGTHLTIQGVGRFTGTYYLTRVRHRYDLTRGYQSEFTGESAWFGVAS